MIHNAISLNLSFRALWKEKYIVLFKKT